MLVAHYVLVFFGIVQVTYGAVCFEEYLGQARCRGAEQSMRRVLDCCHRGFGGYARRKKSVREYKNGPIVKGVYRCRVCRKKLRKVPPSWSAWSVWGQCNGECGQGQYTRHRDCIHNNQTVTTNRCPGSRIHDGVCDTGVECPPVWLSWSAWSACSVLCGDGVRPRLRQCVREGAPAPGACIGEHRDHTPCVTQFTCPDSGSGWTPWTAWSGCNSTCGSGFKHRERLCLTDTQTSGNTCDGITMETSDCLNVHCPVDGDWSVWSDWSVCSMTCGNQGRQSRMRTCDAPAPLAGGEYCVGPSHDVRKCEFSPCAVDGQWSPWTYEGSCSQQCSGTRQRIKIRQCKDPAPFGEGRECVGSRRVSMNCTNDHITCPEAGSWCDWSNWTPFQCDVRDDKIIPVRSRTRECACPMAFNGGQECRSSPLETDNRPTDSGDCDCLIDDQPIDNEVDDVNNVEDLDMVGNSEDLDEEVEECDDYDDICKEEIGVSTEKPIVPVLPDTGEHCNPPPQYWLNWGAWSECSHTCRTGVRSRTRPCALNNCHGQQVQKETCNAHVECPKGHWLDWSAWNACTGSCDDRPEGERTRRRWYRLTSRRRGYVPQDVREGCLLNCPVFGQWSAWMPWTDCSQTCGVGIRRRERYCDAVLNCIGHGSEVSQCQQVNCPVDGGWSAWQTVSDCPTDCGASHHPQRRQCDAPRAMYDGKECTGPSESESDVPCRSGRRCKECGRPSLGLPGDITPGRIVHGTHAASGAYPWFTLFKIVSRFERRVFRCAGALISDRWVLTAAHCITHQRGKQSRSPGKRTFWDKKQTQVILGARNCAGDAGVTARVATTRFHPRYNSSTNDNDIGLIKLKERIIQTDRISALCYKIDGLRRHYDVGYVAGCGDTQHNGSSAEFITEITIPIQPAQVCENSTDRLFSKNMMCAGTGTGQHGDACQGDSGSVLVTADKKRFIAAGIVSWGQGCDAENHFGYYTKVENYVKWIDRVIREEGN